MFGAPNTWALEGALPGATALATVLEPDLPTHRDSAPTSGGTPPIDNQALIAIAVEILRLRDAEHQRRLAPLMARVAALSPAPDTTPQ